MAYPGTSLLTVESANASREIIHAGPLLNRGAFHGDPKSTGSLKERYKKDVLKGEQDIFEEFAGENGNAGWHSNPQPGSNMSGDQMLSADPMLGVQDINRRFSNMRKKGKGTRRKNRLSSRAKHDYNSTESNEELFEVDGINTTREVSWAEWELLLRDSHQRHWTVMPLDDRGRIVPYQCPTGSCGFSGPVYELLGHQETIHGVYIRDDHLNSELRELFSYPDHAISYRQAPPNDETETKKDFSKSIALLSDVPNGDVVISTESHPFDTPSKDQDSQNARAVRNKDIQPQKRSFRIHCKVIGCEEINFTSPAQLFHHERSLHRFWPEAASNFICIMPECQEKLLTFDSPMALLSHERADHGATFWEVDSDPENEDVSFLCGFQGCDRAVSGYGFGQRTYLNNHLLSAHQLQDESIKSTDKSEEEILTVANRETKHPRRVFRFLDDVLAAKPDLPKGTTIRGALTIADGYAKQANTFYNNLQRPDLALEAYIKVKIVFADFIPRHTAYSLLQRKLNGKTYPIYSRLSKWLDVEKAKFAKVEALVKENNAKYGTEFRGLDGNLSQSIEDHILPLSLSLDGSDTSKGNFYDSANGSVSVGDVAVPKNDIVENRYPCHFRTCPEYKNGFHSQGILIRHFKDAHHVDYRLCDYSICQSQISSAAVPGGPNLRFLRSDFRGSNEEFEEHIRTHHPGDLRFPGPTKAIEISQRRREDLPKVTITGLTQGQEAITEGPESGPNRQPRASNIDIEAVMSGPRRVQDLTLEDVDWQLETRGENKGRLETTSIEGKSNNFNQQSFQITHSEPLRTHPASNERISEPQQEPPSDQVDVFTGDKEISAPRPGEKSAGMWRCEHSDCWDTYDKFRFFLLADLYQHYQESHPEIQRKAWLCDYKDCGRSEDPFTRKDTYRDHLREFHKEDMLKRYKTKERQQEWLATRSVSAEEWRCVRCLARIKVSEDGWNCKSCDRECEPERVAFRKSTLEALVEACEGHTPSKAAPKGVKNREQSAESFDPNENSSKLQEQEHQAPFNLPIRSFSTNATPPSDPAKSRNVKGVYDETSTQQNSVSRANSLTLSILDGQSPATVQKSLDDSYAWKYSCQMLGCDIGLRGCLTQELLDDHYRTVHKLEQVFHDKCDYSDTGCEFCPEDGYSYRIHLRDQHKEDIYFPRGSSSGIYKWWTERLNSERWWRCTRCLDRVTVSFTGYACARCFMACEIVRFDHRNGKSDSVMNIQSSMKNTLANAKEQSLPSTEASSYMSSAPPVSDESRPSSVVSTLAMIEFTHTEYMSHKAVPFTTIKQLGYGSLSIVDAVRRLGNDDGAIMARKVIRLTSTARKRLLPFFQQEVAVLRALTHAHIVRVVSTYETTSHPRQFAILISPAGDEDLTHFLERVAEEEYPDEEISLLSGWKYCLTSAVAYIHSQNIRHKDIKPSNIICKGDQVYLTDFGSAHQFTVDLTSTTEGDFIGMTKMYSAPEVIADDRRGRRADIYSLGCVFAEMASVANGKSVDEFYEFRSEPLPDDPDRMTAVYHATAHKIGPWFKMLGDEGTVDLLRDMLAAEQKQRPTANEVLVMLAKNGQPTTCICTLALSRHGYGSQGVSAGDGPFLSRNFSFEINPSTLGSQSATVKH